ncbi:PQQ-like beta-propeller repeat protein [Catenulispora pinisilvae]|uniref:PQQ-like beta-propeller repeat protein n=1 Tax=Catenulispora pinisilvae TaxID=2705253 RepID=UPI0018926428|nr:PQQ-like beta-propeller repeat protein [Catenulispora pinisilvae]
MANSALSRRRLLQAGGAGILGTAAGPLLSTSASAAPATTLAAAAAPATAAGRAPTITDLGPGVVQFSLMSGLRVGDVLYIGSRNLSPPRVIGFDLGTRKVVSHTELSAGYTIQALAADPTGRYLYAGTLSKTPTDPANLFRWDLTNPGAPAVALGEIGDRDVRAVATAPDDTLYAVGGGSDTAPALWQYDPASGAISNLGIPDPGATLAKCVAATDTTVFFGAGSLLAGGNGASKASLFAYDRASKKFTSIVPRELAGDPSLRDLAVIGDLLAIGTSGSGGPGTAHFAAMDLDDYSSYTVLASNGLTVKKFAAVASDIYYSTDLGLQAYSTTAKTLTTIGLNGLDLGEIWGVDAYAGKVEVTSAYGFVAEIAPQTGAATVTDLGSAGAPTDPQLCMGVAAGGGYAYIGGTGSIARHSLKDGTVVDLQFPGEAKHAVVLDGVLYTSQYDSEGIWRYDPASGKPQHQVAQFPPAQNRPVGMCWDSTNELILVGLQDDSDGGGSLVAYNPCTGKARSWINPIDQYQMIRAVASHDGIAYLGGDNAQHTGPRGTILAWNPVAGRELWRLESKQTLGLSALAVRDRHLYGLSLSGGFFVVDLNTHAIVHTQNLGAICPGFSQLLVNRGVVYAVSDTTLFRFDPKTFAVTVVAAGINGAWYSGPSLNNDERGLLYTLRGHNLVRIDDHPHP